MLTSFVSVYVPSTVHAAKISRAAHHAAVSKVAGAFSKALGGATSIPARGYWQSESEGLIEESITIVKSYYVPSQAQEAIELCRALALGIKTEFAQEAVTIETNEGIEFL